MRPPIISYSLFVEEILLWILHPLGVNTLIQFLCLRCARQIGLEHTEWITYMAPGTALFFFVCSTTRFTSYVRHRVFVATSPRLVLLTMRMSVMLWAALAVMVLYSLKIAFHHISHGTEGNLTELYSDKIFIFTIVAATTLFQIFKPSEEA